MKRMTIYQILPRLWGKGRFSSFDDAFFAHMRDLRIDAVWYTGIPRHASGQPFVKGNPGSPYSISDYYDVNPYLADDEEGRMDEFQRLVRSTHSAGLKVITDFVPNHVSPDNVNGIPVYDHWDYDWTDTRKVDWNDPRTVPAMAEILCFWASKGVDGFRCDMVELVPAGKLSELISSVRRNYPSLVFISEVYNKDSYYRYAEAGFDLLYDKSGFYDISRDVITRGDSVRNFTRNWQALGPLQGAMLNFLENHDERRFASSEFASSPLKAYAAMAVAALFNGASVMLYFGQEAGEKASEASDGRTSIFNYCRPASVGRLFRELHGEAALLPEEKTVLSRYRELLSAAARAPFAEGRNYDLCWCQGEGFDPDRHFAFVRYDGPDDAELVICNFSAETSRIRVCAPKGEDFPSSEYEAEVRAWDFKILKMKDNG